jgi:hypothetical protein
LLKNTCQFRREADTALYEKIDLVREKLGLGDLTVTAYQAQNGNDPELNASIVYLHGEAHLVFSGPILERLNEAELLAVIAHELTHIRLYTLLDGDLEVADRIVTAIANNYTSDAPYYETARLFRLYTEIFCDRGACAVLGDSGPVITSLVKIATHPGNFIRARALRLWQEQGDAAKVQEVVAAEAQVEAAAAGLVARAAVAATAEEAIVLMIEGKPGLDRLDLFSQQELNGLTGLFLQEYLRPKWFQSTLVMGLAREYFPVGLAAGLAVERSPGGGDGTGPGDSAGGAGGSDSADSGDGTDSGLAEADRERLIDAITSAHPSIRDYFSYLLLDFVLADPSLEEMPAGRAFEFAGEMQLSAVFDPIYKKELQLSDKKWQQYRQKVLEAYAKAVKDQSIL